MKQLRTVQRDLCAHYVRYTLLGILSRQTSQEALGTLKFATFSCTGGQISSSDEWCRVTCFYCDSSSILQEWYSQPRREVAITTTPDHDSRLLASQKPPEQRKRRNCVSQHYSTWPWFQVNSFPENLWNMEDESYVWPLPADHAGIACENTTSQAWVSRVEVPMIDHHVE